MPAVCICCVLIQYPKTDCTIKNTFALTLLRFVSLASLFFSSPWVFNAQFNTPSNTHSNITQSYNNLCIGVCVYCVYLFFHFFIKRSLPQSILSSNRSHLNSLMHQHHSTSVMCLLFFQHFSLVLSSSCLLLYLLYLCHFPATSELSGAHFFLFPLPLTNRLFHLLR